MLSLSYVSVVEPDTTSPYATAGTESSEKTNSLYSGWCKWYPVYPNATMVLVSTTNETSNGAMPKIDSALSFDPLNCFMSICIPHLSESITEYAYLGICRNISELYCISNSSESSYVAFSVYAKMSTPLVTSSAFSSRKPMHGHTSDTYDCSMSINFTHV